jgi:hypothetical protein
MTASFVVINYYTADSSFKQTQCIGGGGGSDFLLKKECRITNIAGVFCLSSSKQSLHNFFAVWAGESTLRGIQVVWEDNTSEMVGKQEGTHDWVKFGSVCS